MVHTPVFDRVAREGVLFRHAFCPVPSCSPTRSSILTGRMAHQLEDAASLWSAFPRKLQVFTQMLSQAGYEVAFTAKGWAPGRFKEYGWDENPAGKQFASFEEFMQKRDPAKPFCFWYGNTDTTLPRWRPGPAGAPGLDPSRVVVPPMLPDVPEVRTDMLAYYGGVERMDKAFGDAIALIEAAGALDNTVVVYTGDNGWQMPRGLANCYDTGTRVPLAVRWGDKLPAGRIVDAFVSLTDLAPTFLELASLKPTPEMTGRSFVDLLRGKPSAVPRDHVFVERERHANVRRGNLSYPIRGIRTRDYLYLWNLRPERWPAGDPHVYVAVGDYGDVDGSTAKQYILAHQDAHGDPPVLRPQLRQASGGGALRPEQGPAPARQCRRESRLCRHAARASRGGGALDESDRRPPGGPELRRLGPLSLLRRHGPGQGRQAASQREAPLSRLHATTRAVRLPRAGLVARPEEWEWSSYPGYVSPARRRAWVRYETLLSAWRGEWGGADAAEAYRGYVEAGLSDPPSSPFRDTFGGWVLGSRDFLERLRTLAGANASDSPPRKARQLAGLEVDTVLAAVREYYDLDADGLRRSHDRHIGRALAAWLCRRHTIAPLRELTSALGLRRPTVCRVWCGGLKGG